MSQEPTSKPTKFLVSIPGVDYEARRFAKSITNITFTLTAADGPVTVKLQNMTAADIETEAVRIASLRKRKMQRDQLTELLTKFAKIAKNSQVMAGLYLKLSDELEELKSQFEKHAPKAGPTASGDGN